MAEPLLPALWGLLGALIYAAPRLSACIFMAKESRGPIQRCLSEAVVSLIVGAVAAAAFARWTAAFLHQTGAGGSEAVAALIGVLANPAAPAVINVLQSRILERLRGDDK